jgi:putative ABC transport system permease protein
MALNLWMVQSFEVSRLENSRVIAGAVIMLILGQLAVLYPALRAASIPPAWQCGPAECRDPCQV